MNQEEFAAAVKSANAIFVWVLFNKDQGGYVRVTKGAIADQLGVWWAGVEFDTVFDADGRLFIN